VNADKFEQFRKGRIVFRNKDKVISRVAEMPRGEFSPSNRYWCVTCKMLFDIEKPVCPYMPKICVNTPIPVELIPPETTGSLEKFGLFYPKIPQRLMAHLTTENEEETGEALAQVYKDFVKDWHFPYTTEPLQTLKSFIIMISGAETAQRVQENKFTFVVTDAQKVWDPGKLQAVLQAGVEELRKELEFEQEITFDSMEIIGDMPMGKYYCPMCRKFFEFSIQRDTITCPLMPQKCMATPRTLDKARYSLMDLLVVYDHTPDIYKRLLSVFPDRERAVPHLKELLQEEWEFELEDEPLEGIRERLGLS
jgi:hypothetical protein